MIIRLQDLPSTGWKSELPNELDMRPFSGTHTRLIAQAIEQKSMGPVFEALAQCFDVDVGMLTIPDAYFLVFLQRLRSSHVKPIALRWTCKKPIYEYTDGSFTELKDDRSPLLVRPCDHREMSSIVGDSLTVLKLQNTHPEFNVPRLKNWAQASSSTFDWVAAHLDVDHRAAIARLEVQENLDLWTELSDWVSASQHGIQTGVSCVCTGCQRDTDIEWTFGPELFA